MPPKKKDPVKQKSVIINEIDEIVVVERTECSCTESETSIPADRLVPETIPFFVYDPPTEPALILQTNFHCDDICNWNPENILEKMTPRWDDDTKRLCLIMLEDVKNHFQNNSTISNFQLLAVVELFFYTFKYFVNSKVANMQDTADFYQEQLLRYCVEHPPKSAEVFSIDEAHVLLEFFKTFFMPHLLLLRAVTANNSVVRIQVASDELFQKKGKKK